MTDPHKPSTGKPAPGVRDLIAATIYTTWLNNDDVPDAHTLADAIITALGLTPEQWLRRRTYSYGTTYPNAPVEDRRLTRYTTTWVADE